MYTVKTRLYQTLDGKVVPEGHKDARFLYRAPGQVVSTEEAKKRGLSKIDSPKKASKETN